MNFKKGEPVKFKCAELDYESIGVIKKTERWNHGSMFLILTLNYGGMWFRDDEIMPLTNEETLIYYTHGVDAVKEMK